MATTQWDIVTRIQNRIKDIPSALGSPQIAGFVEEAASEVGNFTGSTPTLSNIGSSHFSVLTNLGAAYTLAYMEGVGVSYNLGRMRIEKLTELEGHYRQLNFFAERAKRDLDGL